MAQTTPTATHDTRAKAATLRVALMQEVMTTAMWTKSNATPPNPATTLRA